jgi:hypothetical protein
MSTDNVEQDNLDIPTFLDRRGDDVAACQDVKEPPSHDTEPTIDATVETNSGERNAQAQAKPTPEQLAEARERAAKLGLTIRGRKNFVLDDGEERDPCGGFAGLVWHIERREAIARGEPTSMMSECGAVGTVFMHDKDDTSFHVIRQADGSYKKTGGYKTAPETGETIQFKILEDGTQQETRRFPKEDDDETPEPSAQVLTLVRRIKALVEKADRAADKAEQFYKSAGIHIKEIKEQSEDWETIVREQCGLGRSRAYELMAIADGKVTLEKVRADANERKKVHRTKSDGASVPERTEPGPINQRVTGSAEVSIEQRRAENARLADPIEEDGAPGPTEEPDDPGVADAAEIEDSALHSLGRNSEHARLFKKLFKLSAFDREAKDRIITAIETMIKKWRSTQATLTGTDHIVEQCLSLMAAMTKEQRAQFFAKYTELSAAKAPVRP